MRGYVFITKSLAQMPRNSLSHASRVDEDERRLVFANKVGDAIVNLFPDFVGHQSLERRTRNFECEIEFATMTAVDDRAVRRSARIDVRSADKKSRYFFDRFLGCG